MVSGGPPSIRAASSISGGICAKKARSIQIAKGSAKAVLTRISAVRRVDQADLREHREERHEDDDGREGVGEQDRAVERCAPPERQPEERVARGDRERERERRGRRRHDDAVQHIGRVVRRREELS